MFTLIGWLHELDRVKTLPWRGGLIALASGFLLATLITTGLSYVISPDSGKAMRSLSSSKSRSSILPEERVSLSSTKVKQIIERNIFNKEGKTGDDEISAEKTEETGPVTHELLKTTLPLQLLGTIFSGDPFSGIAIIQDKSSNARNSFFVGQQIQAGVILAEIHREKVILQRPDRQEYLELEQPEVTKKRHRGKKPQEITKPSNLADKAPRDAYKEEGFERAGEKIVMSSDFRKKLLTVDFAKVLQDAKAEPHLVNGELSGFRLIRIRQDSIYEKSGLQDGDIIREINGVSLIDTAQAIRLLNSLRSENELEVRLERDGSAKTINLQIR
ncbi:MAG: PDZ domain-containing protein [Deltaproteobacteria bacterium]|nr:PDZ domain-containing protein [Deltaproteobacteria bacterium]